MKSLELEAEELKLALTQIMMTSEQSLAEKVGKEDADRSLKGFEEAIENFLHELGNKRIWPPPPR
jgi:hypothetical protein